MACLWKCRACDKLFSSGVQRRVFDDAIAGNHYDRLLHLCELPKMEGVDTTLKVVDGRGIADCVGWVDEGALPHAPRPTPAAINELGAAARELLGLIDSIEGVHDDQTDRVFAQYEFARLRTALGAVPGA